MPQCLSCHSRPHKPHCTADRTISRQLRYQRRHMVRYLCRLCPQPNVDGTLCAKHIKDRRRRLGIIGRVRCSKCRRLGHNRRSCDKWAQARVRARAQARARKARR